MKKIFVVTGSRADYGLLRPLIRRIQKSEILELMLVVTGSHLSAEFGLTADEIVADGHQIYAQVEMQLSSDSGVGTGKSLGLGIIGFSDALNMAKPDAILVLGDRYEILAVVCAALFLGIPVVHLHGGEKTEGSFDDAIRHAITKMSQYHFVAAPEYRHRVIQLGEQPDRVVVSGGLGVDAAHRANLLSRKELEQELGFTLASKNLLITFHPAPLSQSDSVTELSELLEALHHFDHCQLLFTGPNADSQGRELKRMTLKFCNERPNAHFIESLGSSKYYSCLSIFDAMVGNSSSGLAEAPSFGLPTINVGDRQQGRLRAETVVDVPASKPIISSAIEAILKSRERTVPNRDTEVPYGEPGSTEIIAKMLENTDFLQFHPKSFHDLPTVGP